MDAYFKAELGPKFKVVTYVLATIIILVPLSMGIILAITASPWLGLVSLVGFLILFATRAFVCNGYRITTKTLMVERWAKTIIIPLTDIQEIRSSGALGAAMSALRGHITWRLLGDGGLWGVHGLFYNKNIGKFYMYITDERRVVDVVTKKGTHFFISPNSTDGFLQALQ